MHKNSSISEKIVAIFTTCQVLFLHFFCCNVIKRARKSYKISIDICVKTASDYLPKINLFYYNKKLSFGSCKCSKGKPQDLFIKTCDFMNVTFIMRKNANIHHYEMYIIGQNIMASEEIIILHIFSLPDLRYTKQINLKWRKTFLIVF